ncbi:response regulator receiver modulated metal dependent phosphohydrolase [Methylorubrum populi BJ001]|jgi:putative two-component system response regulator|uniref:Response regulator receiver modulated metal dependent phosphohydrolase n=1 Tax=Methylorubrum populi (strain ATCC BAA-705 / NCIMB 13946 / BJ001) TaxID=441620 RepID=B1ZAG5_METPB|nr:HD domain-containing phosphohydrolase [Methylorubrum populi]ACB82021.1 response regulator receiver modulated metal dependent phosphohydrolase [Methylorubrum populi BJ001]OAH22758.1 transcriptional regulator [Methylorubrum populi]PZP69166.1 MAG: two-component system response regulator [Methylorubrum populi]
MLALVLDDAEMNNLVMVASLRPLAGCRPHDFTVPADALAFAQARASEIGIVITDYDMPGMDGIAFIRAVRRIPGLANVPAIMVTSHDQRSLRREALEAGATDFLTKPADAVEIRARVTNLLALSEAHRLQRDHAAQLAREVATAVALVEEREREIVSTLMRAAEHRDSDTGDHIARVSAYVGLIAEAMRMTPAETRQMSLAATMHDVGKIAVPDAILLKPGALTPEERREMEQHAERGRRILSGSASPVMRLAAEIAGSHHERWDGTGYPQGLTGEAIPLSGRMVAVADVFDALTTERPYKQAWSPERARAYLQENAGSHFDPEVVAAFLGRWEQVQTFLALGRDGAPVPDAA